MLVLNVQTSEEERNQGLTVAAEAYVVHRMRCMLSNNCKITLTPDGDDLSPAERRRLTAEATYFLTEFEQLIDTNPGRWSAAVRFVEPRLVVSVA